MAVAYSLTYNCTVLVNKGAANLFVYSVRVAAFLVTENYGAAVCFWHGNENNGTGKLFANNCVFANNGGSGACYGAAVLCTEKSPL